MYALVAGKRPKLKQEDAEAGLRISTGPKCRRLSGKVSLARLADSLSNWMERPVLDMIGIKGIFEMKSQRRKLEQPQVLRWMPGTQSRIDLAQVP